MLTFVCVNIFYPDVDCIVCGEVFIPDGFFCGTVMFAE